ncbi:hypothetical protein K3495_g17466, partial [Podosphaera aphanis]
MDEETMILDNILTNKGEDEPVGGFFIAAEYEDDETSGNFITLSDISDDSNAYNIILLSKLQDVSVFHSMTGEIPTIFKTRQDIRERYDDSIWHGIMVDT